MRLTAAIRADVTFQFRHFLYYAYVLVSLFYIGLLTWIPDAWKEQTALFLLFTDCSFLGAFFIGGIVLLEKDQGIYDQLFVTPITVPEFIWSKVLSLGILSLASSTFIFITAFGFTIKIFPLLIGMSLNSVFASLLGLIFAVRVKSINQFLMVSPLFATIFFLPVLETIGFYDSIFFYFIPGKAGLLLMEGAFRTLTSAEWIYSFALFAAYIFVAYKLAYRSFYQAIILKIGG